MAFTQDTMNNVSSGRASQMTIWSYKNTSDTLATIQGANYFGAQSQALHLDDMIYVVGSDGTAQLSVTSVVNASSVTTSLYSGAGSVDTADIVDLAVTTAKIAALNVTAAKLEVAIPRTATVALTAAEFNGMYAAPKLLVAAGGANTMHIVHKVVYEVNYGAAQFASGGVVAVQYDSTANGAGTDASADVAAAVFNGYTADSVVGADGEVASAASSTTVNKGLYLSNETGAFTTGDSTLNVHVTYSTVTTTV